MNVFYLNKKIIHLDVELPSMEVFTNNRTGDAVQYFASPSIVKLDEESVQLLFDFVEAHPKIGERDYEFRMKELVKYALLTSRIPVFLRYLRSTAEYCITRYPAEEYDHEFLRDELYGFFNKMLEEAYPNNQFIRLR